MLASLLLTAANRAKDYIGATEDWVGGLTFVGFWFIVIAAFTIFFLGICVFVYNGEMYKLVPGWGPIVKFDNDGTEDLRINQILMRRHAAQAQVGSGGSDGRGGGAGGLKSEFEATSGVHIEGYGSTSASYRVPGASVGHPEFAEVIVRPNFNAEMEKRMAREDYARDEIYWRQVTGHGSRRHDPHDYEHFVYKLV